MGTGDGWDGNSLLNRVEFKGILRLYRKKNGAEDGNVQLRDQRKVSLVLKFMKLQHM